MGAAKVLVIYWHEKAMIPPAFIRCCRRAWTRHSQPFQQAWIGSEISSQAMMSFDAHQGAVYYSMNVSTLQLRLPLINVHSIQCAHYVPPSSIYPQQHGDICIPQALLCAIYAWFPASSLILKRRNELEWQKNSNKCFNPPNIALGGIF
jgi:hypothetical protein